VTSKRFPIGLDRVGHGKTSAAAPARAVAITTPNPTDERPALFGHAPLGLATAGMQQRMVARLAMDGVSDPRVLQAMAQIPRDAFLDSALVAQAFEDTSLPIGHGQTISKPSTVARMLALLLEGEGARRLGHAGRTLEIGTGCGYQAALLSLLSPSVISVERIRPLHDEARESLAHVPQARRTALRLVLGDGRLGHPPNAPYDSIIAAAVGDDVPQAWVDQLAVGGRLVAPINERDQQVLLVMDRSESGVTRRLHEAVRFVPLESGVVR
jgi:protein-L-isoaspartate(D-aspartate) O-methyltransferase